MAVVVVVVVVVVVAFVVLVSESSGLEIVMTSSARVQARNKCPPGVCCQYVYLAARTTTGLGTVDSVTCC